MQNLYKMTKIAHQDNFEQPIEIWNFTSEEWNAFTNEAKLLKNEDNIYFGIGILIVGIPYLMFFRNTTFILATAFVLPFAIALPYLRFIIALRNIKPTKKPASIKFYKNYIDMNGKHIELFNDKKWIKFMQILESDKGLPPLLEIEIAWNTRNGNTFDETRVPIPLDKMEKAKELIEFYRERQHL